MFGRKKPAKDQVGEPTPARERVRTEDSVLDELSRAFGTAGNQHEEQDAARDDNAALISDDSREGDSCSSMSVLKWARLGSPVSVSK